MRPMRMGLGKRGAWAGLLAGVGALGLLEVAVLHFVVGAYAPRVVTAVLDVLFGVPTLALLVAMASPLWSVQRVSGEQVRLRFGWLAALDVPLRIVRTAEPHRPSVRHPAQTGLDFADESATVSLIRSPASELVRVEFTEAVHARIQGFRRVRARSAVLSVDDAAEFCAAVAARRSAG
ncbi:hypothetical protein [Nocardia brasiliensis]|uniref:hypothetical protein n=1 Tax=Nocardia brasiliensis TaxID=37326 RepID=UPI001E2D8657|nr:hypothetical protein [Nocardia brasiliensis]MBF6541915.1 hypothetical protein [Nocardia brasiliensis]